VLLSSALDQPSEQRPEHPARDDDFSSRHLASGCQEIDERTVLGQIAGRARFERGDQDLDVFLAGKNDDPAVGHALADLGCDPNTVAVGQTRVEEGDVWARPLSLSYRLESIPGFADHLDVVL